jgi:hypothetical protein
MRRDRIGLDGPLRGGESGGLVVGEAAVRDMMGVGKELENG